MTSVSCWTCRVCKRIACICIVVGCALHITDDFKINCNYGFSYTFLTGTWRHASGINSGLALAGTKVPLSCQYVAVLRNVAGLLLFECGAWKISKNIAEGEGVRGVEGESTRPILIPEFVNGEIRWVTSFRMEYIFGWGRDLNINLTCIHGVKKHSSIVLMTADVYTVGVNRSLLWCKYIFSEYNICMWHANRSHTSIHAFFFFWWHAGAVGSTGASHLWDLALSLCCGSVWLESVCPLCVVAFPPGTPTSPRTQSQGWM